MLDLNWKLEENFSGRPGSTPRHIHLFLERRTKLPPYAQGRQARRYRLFFSISETAKSQARAVSAMYVSDGFTQEEETMQAPSVRKRFFASWAWLCWLSTEVFGSRPMRAVPISWMARPGGVIS